MRFTNLSSFPALLDNPDPILDTAQRINVPIDGDSPFGGSVTIYDHSTFMPTMRSPNSGIGSGGGGGASGGANDDADVLAQVTPLTRQEVSKLHRHVIQVRRVVRMTGKGKVSAMAAMCVVGNGNGLVGFGQGREENAGPAAAKAFQNAVKNMDYVHRFEARTIDRSLVGDFSATKVYMRPRPPGFGLRCPPAVHAIARSCGITDLSASILGSTNPINVCRATLTALWGGSNPTGLGDGIGGRARRSDLGIGAKTIQEIEMERGRRFRHVAR